jgi:leucyl/phenylalanyl-tRNA--protein transferase
VLLAYRSGIFPMADSRDDPDIFWVEPKRRGICRSTGCALAFAGAHAAPRRFRDLQCGLCRGGGGLRRAAKRRSDDGESGGNLDQPRIAATYQKLHEMGHAHSVECWMADGEGATGWSAAFTAWASTGCSAAKACSAA